jgi:glycosyltransferase involved in cell wall biosynthesis
MLVTVVTPALNGMPYLPGCIESVQRQERPGLVEVEHIVVDGGSTDGTAEYAAGHGCIVMGRERPSVTYALNKGFAHANGTLIGMLGCDDRLLPGALATVVATYQREGRRWLSGGSRYIDSAGRSHGNQPAPPSWLTAPMLGSLTWSCVPHMSTYVERSLHDELGGLDETFSSAPDYDFFCRVLAARIPFSRIPEALSAQTRHDANLSAQRTPQLARELALIEERWAPRSRSRRLAYRYLLKAWVNAASPAWFLHKKLPLRGSPPPGGGEGDAGERA